MNLLIVCAGNGNRYSTYDTNRRNEMSFQVPGTWYSLFLLYARVHLNEQLKQINEDAYLGGTCGHILDTRYVYDTFNDVRSTKYQVCYLPPYE